MGGEADQPLRKLELAIAVKPADSKAEALELRGNFRRVVQAEDVRLVVAAPGVIARRAAEGRDAARQAATLRVFVGRERADPIVPIAKVARAAGRDAAGRRHVEQQHAARLEGPMNPPQQWRERPGRVPPVEQVAEDLADRGQRDGRRQLGVEKRADAELGRRGAAPRLVDHGRRKVVTEHVVAGLGEGGREDSAAAAQVDHPASGALLLAQVTQQLQRRVLGHHAEPSVVDVCQVFAVEGRRCHRRIQMRTRLVRYGRGFALPIEQSLFDELGIGESTALEINVDGKVIVVRALDDAEDRKARFQAVLDDVNRRYGSAMRRLADS